MAPDQTAPIPAGWYSDPYGASEMRWWDGQNWTDSIHPPAAPTPDVAEPSQPEPERERETALQPERTPQGPEAVEPHSEPVTDTDPFGALGFDVAQSSDRPEREPEPAPAEPTPAEPTPVAHTPVAQDPIAATPEPHTPEAHTPGANIPELQPPELPSRRELRQRMQRESEQPTTADPGVASAGVASTDASGISSPIPAAGAAYSPVPTSAPGPVPDSSTPTAFDWLPNGDSDSSEFLSAAPTAQEPPTPQPVPSFQAAPSDEPPFGGVGGPVPVSAAGANEFSRENGAEHNPWAREAGIPGAPDDGIRATATRMATVSSWFIAAMPLIAAILSVSVVKGQENYPRYLPPEFEWWMLVGAVIAVLYVVTVILAAADRRKLDWAGYYQPAHWAWALLGAPVYLLVRTISVKRETGRNSILLWVWLGLTAALVGAWFAVGYFAPELTSGYTLPFL